MTEPPSKKSADIIPLPAKQEKLVGRLAQDKWSKQVIKLGYTALPNLLLQAQARLEITPPELNVLLQIAQHWWEAGNNPHPSKDSIANRMGVSPRQVQRILTQLEKKKLVARIYRYSGGRQINTDYSFQPLIDQLKALEPEFSKEVEQKRLRKKKLEKAKAS
ncbi:helix-turn-helix domain-containing protein [Methyloceanibacter sp.]|uniref:helix-turn-helix domain-containing protein n=1 Tax=Methyloceanibacter sp. TaxID=1965321 RepID=UPI002BEF34E0|nr:helix-turn-helix domain-containing protein [Methyloceanibacter sp.]HML93241.1 helix-turn-helix domain-containing protein [Methyloceanibacter sp.]